MEKLSGISRQASIRAKFDLLGDEHRAR